MSHVAEPIDAWTAATDDDLAAATRSGHDAAMTVLVDRFRPMVRGMASDRFLPGADHDDLVQEGMIGLWHAIRDHDPARGPFGPFARLCVDRQMWAAVTKANRRRHRILQDAAAFEDWMDAPDAAADPEEVVVALDAVQALTAHLRTVLTDLEHEVLTMYADGESYDAMARVLAVHRKRIDNALQRARRKVVAFQQSSAVAA
jgi:RNA polymerase sporulation-specific sigma factor